MKKLLRFSIFSVLLLSLWGAPSAEAAEQPFSLTDHDAVHSDALAARYLVVKEDIYSSEFGIPPVSYPWCRHTDDGGNPVPFPSQACNTAIHRFCMAQHYKTGYGFSPPDHPDKVEITCLSNDAASLASRTYADVEDGLDPGDDIMADWCIPAPPRPYAGWPTPNVKCSIGINRACGAAGGFGPIERKYGESLTYACFAEDLMVNFPPEPPAEIFPSGVCNDVYGFQTVPDVCHQAVAAFCADQNLLSGYGPREISPASLTIGCVHESEIWEPNAELPDQPTEIDILRREVQPGAGPNEVAWKPILLRNLLSSSLTQSYDGRVIMGPDSVNDRIQVFMQMPELFVAPLSQEQNLFPGQAYTFSDYYKGRLGNEGFKHLIESAEIATMHAAPASHGLAPSMAVCDAPRQPLSPAHHNQSQNIPSRESNPYRCQATGVADSTGEHDCYDITMILRLSDGDESVFEDQLWASPVRIIVQDPKTDPKDPQPPKFVDVLIHPDGTEATQLPLGSGLQILEPIVSGNGRLLLAQVDGQIQYSVIPENKDACDATGWTGFKHISEMYADDDMADYGLAKFPLRGVEDRMISTLPGEPPNPIRGAYPWVDRDADNLFFIAADQSLFYLDDESQPQERYPIAGHPLPGITPSSPMSYSEIEDFGGGNRVGLSFVGLWSQGKFSTPDSRNNNLDVTIKDTMPERHRTLQLYTGAPTEIGESVKTVIASPESQFNFLPNLRPETPRDVVWHVATQDDTDEIAFDDVNHPRAFIVSEMSASLAFLGVTRGRYNDGFEWDYSAARDFDGQNGVENDEKKLLKFQGRGFTRAPHVANTASAVSQAVVDFAAAVYSGQTNPLAGAAQWNVPSYGRLLGGARTEPIAAGGFQGRGLWLDGDDWIEYLIEPQPDPAAFAASPWFMTIAVEPTLDGGNTWWRLVTFPDGSALELRSDGQMLRFDWGQALADEILLSSALAFEDGTWSTIGVLSEPGSSNRLAVFVDGLRIAELSDTAIAPFRLAIGDLRVGAESDGFKGWIDDFKVIGAVPTHEEVCNHAGGTLRGFDAPGAATGLISLASSYLVGKGDIHADLSTFIGGLAVPPGQAPPESYDYYFCERPETLPGAKTCLGKTHGPMPAECLRPLVNDLNQRLVWNAVRPDSASNPFCLSCHTETSPSLTMRPSEALVGLVGIEMHDDLRRQPMQASPLLFGAAPADYFGPGDPGTTPPEPINLDEQVHPDTP